MMGDGDLFETLISAILPLVPSLVDEVDALPENVRAKLLEGLRDEILADLAQQGNDDVAEAAFNLLEFRYRAAAKRYVRKRISEAYAQKRVSIAEDVEDVGQEIWVAVWVALRRDKAFVPSRRFIAWLFGIASNQFYTFLRKRHRWQGRETPLDDLVQWVNSLASDDASDSTTMHHEFWREFRRLPEKYRLLLLRRYIEEFSIQKIVDALNASGQSTTPYRVKIDLNMAEMLFKRYLTEKGGSE